MPIDYLVDPKIMKSAWQKQVDAPISTYEPGKFTTLVAFEWSSQPDSKNLHHNVFFRDDGSATIFSAFDSDRIAKTSGPTRRCSAHRARELLDSAQLRMSRNSADVCAAHLGRCSDRQRLGERAPEDSPTEIIQTKGHRRRTRRCPPMTSSPSFETVHALAGFRRRVGLIDNSFVRQALTDGVGFQEMIGANPFKYGIVAGADSHMPLSDNEEFNYPGVHGNIDHPPRFA